MEFKGIASRPKVRVSLASTGVYGLPPHPKTRSRVVINEKPHKPSRHLARELAIQEYLKRNWITKVSHTYGHPYYVNKFTGESTYKNPFTQDFSRSKKSKRRSSAASAASASISRAASAPAAYSAPAASHDASRSASRSARRSSRSSRPRRRSVLDLDIDPDILAQLENHNFDV